MYNVQLFAPMCVHALVGHRQTMALIRARLFRGFRASTATTVCNDQSIIGPLFVPLVTLIPRGWVHRAPCVYQIYPAHLCANYTLRFFNIICITRRIKNYCCRFPIGFMFILSITFYHQYKRDSSRISR